MMMTVVKPGVDDRPHYNIERAALNYLPGQVLLAFASLLALAVGYDHFGLLRTTASQSFIMAVAGFSVPLMVFRASNSRYGILTRYYEVFSCAGKALGIAAAMLYVGTLGQLPEEPVIASVMGAAVGLLSSLRRPAPPVEKIRNKQYLTALHEAGHGIFGAMLDKRFNDGVTLTTGGFDHQAGAAEFGSRDTWKDVDDKSASVILLMLLAGGESESVLGGQNSGGDLADRQKWRNRVVDLLGKRNQPSWFRRDGTLLEKLKLLMALRELEREQRQVVSAVLKENYVVVCEVANILVETNYISPSEMQPFLDRVVVPEWVQTYIKDFPTRQLAA